MAKANDAMIIIGSPESANSNNLYKIARAENGKSYFVENAGQLQNKWLENCRKVGITAGASTPDWIIKDVIAKLKN